MQNASQEQLRKLPSVDRLLGLEQLRGLQEEHGHDLVVMAIQRVLAQVRTRIMQGETSPAPEQLGAQVEGELLLLLSPSLFPLINATGVIIHTNLGRAPLSAAALRAQQEASGYCSLEYDRTAGGRGSRYVHAEDLLCHVTGAEAALVVNNDAGAVLLILTALAREREVVVSRGQLVEIGGGFRVPDVMAQSGARLVEVGTTNRTYTRDYAAVITADTAMLMHVHTSNFRLIGFVHSAPLAELVQLGHQHDLLVVDDIGSGALLDTAQFGLSHEPTVQESLETGADLICFSGDKLLGGPQAGIIVGREAPLRVLRTHPLTRALRVGKGALSALQATLLHYLKGEAIRQVPVWRMMSLSGTDIEPRAEALAASVRAHGAEARLVDGWSTVGGGSVPGEHLATRLVAISSTAPQELAKRLRLGSPAVIARIEEDDVVLDLRTVDPAADSDLRRALESVL